VEVAAADDASLGAALAREDERVVGDRVGLANEDERGVAQLVEAGAHDLRLAAQAVRILDPVVALQVRAADLAAREQRAVVAGDVDLPRLAAQVVDARIERAVAAACRVDRERADDERCFEHGLEREQRVQGKRGRDLRSVDERQPFLRGERERRDGRRRAARRRAGRRSPSTTNSPSPISASVRWASGARSPDAPTDPCDGMKGTRPAL
jgi:hypothetical protein